MLAEGSEVKWSARPTKTSKIPEGSGAKLGTLPLQNVHDLKIPIFTIFDPVSFLHGHGPSASEIILHSSSKI